MTKLRFILALPIVTLLSVAQPPVQGQDLTSSYEMTVKPGFTAAFEEALKTHMEYRNAHGDSWQWEFFQVVVGTNVGTYYARSGEHSWADWDAYYAADFAELLDIQWMATVEPFVKESKNMIEKANLELSRLPDNPEAYTLFNVTNFFLKPDQEPAFFEAIETWRQVIIDANQPFYFLVSTPAAGGEGPMASIVGFSENWVGFEEDEAAMEQMFMDALGEEGAMELFNQFTGSYHYYENFIVLHRPDLSGGGM